jgi:hypothetical protein
LIKESGRRMEGIVEIGLRRRGCVKIESGRSEVVVKR